MKKRQFFSKTPIILIIALLLIHFGCSVNETPESVTVTPASATITAIGDTQQFSAAVSPSSVSQDVTWSISDTSVATISSAGLVTAAAAADGTAIVTATSVEDATIYGTATITVDISTPLTLGTSSLGTFSSSDSENTNPDWYSVSLVAGTTYTIALTTLVSGWDLDFRIYSSKTDSALASATAGSGTSESLSYAPSLSGTYYIKAYVYGSGSESSVQYSMLVQ